MLEASLTRTLFDQQVVLNDLQKKPCLIKHAYLINQS